MVCLGACSGDEAGSPATVLKSDENSAALGLEPTGDTSFVADISAAIDAVEAELGGPQRYFEITANLQLTNIFVAVDDATAAVAYLYIDGKLQSPAPKQTGAEGLTFAGSDVEFDDSLLVARIADELPNTSINALSVYGDGFGATYVAAGRSEVGGLLDIVLTGDGAIVSVDPI